MYWKSTDKTFKSSRDENFGIFLKSFLKLEKKEFLRSIFCGKKTT
jgi:hypothetical protein